MIETTRSHRFALLSIVLLLAGPAFPAGAPRYPSDLIVDEERGWIFTSNEESGSLSALDLRTGEAVAELELDRRARPRALAASVGAGGRFLLAVSERFLHRVAIVEVRAEAGGIAGEGGSDPPPRAVPRLRLLARAATGRLPWGLLFHQRRSSLLVASSGEGEVWEIEPLSGELRRRIPCVEGAKLLAFAETGGEETLLVSGRSEVAALDLDGGRVLWRHAPAGGKALNLNGLAVAGGRAFLSHQVEPMGGVTGPTMIVWGLTLANRVTVLPLSRLAATARGAAPGGPLEWAVALDTTGRGAGDPCAPAVIAGADGRDPPKLLVPSAGTGCLLLVDGLEEPTPPYEMLTRQDRLPEIRAGARPVAARPAAGGKRVYVACSLEDAVFEVDPVERKVLRTLRLGPAPDPTPAHLGARIFHDADRSRGGWYSCQSCHPDGGTEGHAFDTAADGDGGPKRSPGLVGTDKTGPWSWLGRFGTLREQIEASLVNTMAVNGPAAGEEADRLIAYLGTLEGPLPARAGEELGGDPGRGAGIFREAGCAGCHQPPGYTSPGTRDVGFADAYNGNRRFNAPSLLGVRDRLRWLHDGRATTLEAVFRKGETPGPHGEVERLGPRAVADLVAFLKTLGARPE
jgi:cytochrome c peroxidase